MNLHGILGEYEDLNLKNLDEYTVYKALCANNTKPTDFENPEHEVLAERMAFSFVENYPDKETGWGTYFGPMSVVSNGDGTATEWPSLSAVTLEMIEYWTTRAKESGNPMLKARYAGLVWDFSKHITDKSPSIGIGKIYVQALIDIADEGFHSTPTKVFQKLERALGLATAMNKAALIERVKQVLINYEREQAIDDKPGLWGYSFDNLIGNKKIRLTKEEEASIVNELESRLVRLRDSEDPDPWSSEHLGKRLAKYYRRKNRVDDIQRVLNLVGAQYIRSIPSLNKMQAIMQLEQLRILFQEFNLKEEAGDILRLIRDLGPEAQNEFKVVTTKHEIPTKDFEDIISFYTSSGDTTSILMKLVNDFIPKKDRAINEIYRLSKIAPFQTMIGINILDNRGRVVSKVGSLEDDLAGRVVLQISKELELISIFYDRIVERLIAEDKFSISLVTEFVSKSPGIEDNQAEVIERGLRAYFSNDYIVADHILIPFIESVIRKVAEMVGCEIFKPASGGGYHVKQLDQLLREPSMIKSLGSDLCGYLRVVLTDQRGWNLRNNLCHGLNQSEFYCAKVTNRILHVLLCLGALRVNV